MTVVEAIAVKYGPIVVGLAAGTMARFGRMLAIGQRVTRSQVVGHLMMMALVGIFVTYATAQAGIQGDARVFCAAVAALASSDVIQWLATRAWKRLINENIEVQQSYRSELRQTSQVIRSQDHIEERVITGELPPDMQAQLDRMP